MSIDIPMNAPHTRARVPVGQPDPIYRRSDIEPRRRDRSDEVTWRQVVLAMLGTAVATVVLLTLAHVRTNQVVNDAGPAVAAIVRDGETLPAFSTPIASGVPAAGVK